MWTRRTIPFVIALTSMLGSTGRTETSAQVAGSARISGSVYREDGERVPAAVVVISMRDGSVRTIRTNREGSFMFSRLPAGSYVMQACTEEFGPSTPANGELKADADVNQDLRMSSGFVKTAEPSCSMDPAPRPARVYTGEIMSIVLQGEVRNFFRSVASLSGLELDVDPSISGTVAVHLKNIPWDLALDVVLRTSGLGSRLDGRVLRIAAANPALGQDRILMGTATIAGKITGFKLQNPRTQLYVDAPNADGTMQIWPVEWESADDLNEIGIGLDTLKSGDQVIVTGNITPADTIRAIGVQRPSDGFSWGYLSPVRSAASDSFMFVSSTSR